MIGRIIDLKINERNLHASGRPFFCYKSAVLLGGRERGFPFLPAAFAQHIQTLYKYEVAELLNQQRSQVVLDVGGGKECPFLPYVQDRRAHLIVALDCSEEELRSNPLTGCKVVADAAAGGFPF